MVSEDLIDETILKMAHKAGVGKLIAPMEVAVAIVGNNEKEWRLIMKSVKMGVIRQARLDLVEIWRNNAIVELDAVRGLYRFRLKEQAE